MLWRRSNSKRVISLTGYGLGADLQRKRVKIPFDRRDSRPSRGKLQTLKISYEIGGRSSMPIIALVPIVALLAQQPPSSSSLDFEYFKTKVQPILLAKREGHARCVSCHTTGTPMRFQPL